MLTNLVTPTSRSEWVAWWHLGVEKFRKIDPLINYYNALDIDPMRENFVACQRLPVFHVDIGFRRKLYGLFCGFNTSGE